MSVKSPSPNIAGRCLICVFGDDGREPGAEVEFISGGLKGLNGKVLAQLPAQNRIQVLLEFLGNEITVAVSANDILLAPDAN